MASTFNYLVHPHHVSLPPQGHGFQAFYKSLTERVNLLHENEHPNAKCTCFAPLFDVVETPNSYILDGEVPGVGNQASIHVVWLPNQVLVINGTVATPQGAQVDDMKEPEPSHTLPQSEGNYIIPVSTPNLL